ncbi:ATP-binding protein, partial [bacterium]|nr:ATP-binding protein [bacterium]
MNLGIENETLEFKKSTSELKAAMNDICAMLNKHGYGTLYFGVKPNGQVCGQEISASSLNDVARCIKSAIKPMIYPQIDRVNLGGLDVIKVEVKGNERPYSSYGKYFKRVHVRAEDITPDELKHMMLNNDFTSIWENNLTPYGLDDVDSNALESFYNKSVDCGRLEPLEKYNEEELLAILGLYKDGKLNNAGYFLFSSKEPVVLKMAVYVTDARLNFSDINRVHGN